MKGLENLKHIGKRSIENNVNLKDFSKFMNK